MEKRQQTRKGRPHGLSHRRGGVLLHDLHSHIVSSLCSRRHYLACSPSEHHIQQHGMGKRPAIPRCWIKRRNGPDQAFVPFVTECEIFEGTVRWSVTRATGPSRDVFCCCWFRRYEHEKLATFRHAQELIFRARRTNKLRAALTKARYSL